MKIARLYPTEDSHRVGTIASIGTIVHGYKVTGTMFMDTDNCVCNIRASAQFYVTTILLRHNRMSTIMYGHNRLRDNCE